jgi:glycine/D-amino acid oxidase-like deaminating enzyme
VVVLAAGVGSIALCHGVGISLPVRADPAVLVRLSAAPGAVRTIVAGEFEVRQQSDGTLLMPMDYNGETSRHDLAASARRARRLVIDAFDELGDVQIVSAEVGWRPMPTDGEPIIGPEPGLLGLYLAVTHSGITLAAAAGRLIAEEITTGQPAPELAGCRLR